MQFIPAANALDEEALNRATEIDIGGGRTARVLGAEDLIAIALRVSRLKDLARIQAFLDQNAVDLPRLRGVIVEHGLAGAWSAFCLKAGIVDPLELS